MTHIKTFTLLLAAVFGLPWLVLVVYPHASLRNLAPVAYSEEESQAAEGTVFPPGWAGRVANGRLVYAAEGCVYCHTQMLRPTYVAGEDMWREGWGGRGTNWEGGEGKPVPLREPRPQDYLGEEYAFLGIQRNGPDLSNVGWRMPDAAWHHLHLYNPRIVSWRSNMPAYKSLYEKRRIGAKPSLNALKLEGEHAPEEGYEIVPTKRAEALVSYLLSLKKDYLVPRELGGPGIQQEEGSSAGAAAPAPSAGAAAPDAATPAGAAN